MSAEDAYERLRKLVNDDRQRNELEARKYLLECLSSLGNRADTLCHGYVASIVCFQPEDAGRYGPCDLVVVAEIIEATEERRRRAYIWEVKAPQNHLFEEETRNRARPSPYLIKAENQLFHYHEDRAGSEAFRKEFGLISSEDVLLGGVIIGRSNNILRSAKNLPIQEGERIYHTALRLRRRYIYTRNNMELMTWSNVLRRLQPAKLGRSEMSSEVLPDAETMEVMEEEIAETGAKQEKRLTA